MMTVGQLKQFIADYDMTDDLPILIATDPEGNGFRALEEIDFALIDQGADKHGYVDDVTYESDLAEADDPANYEGRLVFWP